MRNNKKEQDATKKMPLHLRVKVLGKAIEWVNKNTSRDMVRVEATEKHSIKVIDRTQFIESLLVYTLISDNG